MTAAILAALLLQAAPGPPVRAASGTVPDTVTVGDRFRVAVRLTVPPGSRVRFPFLGAGDTLQQVAGTRAAAGQGTATAVYPMVAWIAGLRPEHSVPIVVIGPGGDSTAYLVPLRLPFVRSVLPADTTGLRPKPAKPPLPLGRPREWYRLALVGLAVAAALTVLAWLYRRRRRPVAAIPLDPREAALAELERLRAGVLEPLRAGPVEASAYAAAYTAGLRVLREFVAAVRPDWGLELTGGELVERLAAARLPAETTGELRSLVGRAEPVKFAGTEPAFADAERFWAGLEAWVASFPLPAEPGPREAA